MGTYKVIQDIESEDHLIGWMTPRQTIYAAIVLISGFIGFTLSTNGAWFLAIILLPHMILFSVLSGPFVHDQSSEIWLLAKIQFFLKPKRRIWNQSGVQELVTITVPKKVERVLTDGLSQNEVNSRLSALANTLDSRGWAVKNTSLNTYAPTSYDTSSSDRLITQASLPQAVTDSDIGPQDDILDTFNNPAAAQLDGMITQAAQAHRQQVVQQMQAPATAQPTDPWFMNNTSAPQPTKLHSAVQTPRTPPTVKKTHMKKTKPAQAATKSAADPPVANPVAQQYATNNDLNVATIARQANKRPSVDDDEVVISLH